MIKTELFRGDIMQNKIGKWNIASRIELLLAKIAGHDVDINTMTPPVATNLTEELMLEIAERMDNSSPIIFFETEYDKTEYNPDEPITFLVFAGMFSDNGGVNKVNPKDIFDALSCGDKFLMNWHGACVPAVNRHSIDADISNFLHQRFGDNFKAIEFATVEQSVYKTYHNDDQVKNVIVTEGATFAVVRSKYGYAFICKLTKEDCEIPTAMQAARRPYNLGPANDLSDVINKVNELMTNLTNAGHLVGDSNPSAA